MAVLLWNIAEQKPEGVFPDAAAANAARDSLISRSARLDDRQAGHVGRVTVGSDGQKHLTTAHFENHTVT